MQTLVSRSTPSEIFLLDTKIFTCSNPGVLHCVEESVIEMCSQVSRRPESSTGAGSLSQSLTEPPALPRPVRLDPLSPEITPNSLCSLTGQSRLRILWFHLTVLLCFSFNLSLNNCSGRYPFPPYHWVSGSSPRGPRSSRVFCPTTLKTDISEHPQGSQRNHSYYVKQTVPRLTQQFRRKLCKARPVGFLPPYIS